MKIILLFETFITECSGPEDVGCIKSSEFSHALMGVFKKTTKGRKILKDKSLTLKRPTKIEFEIHG